MSNTIEHNQLECLRCHTTMEFVGRQTWLTVSLVGNTFSVFRCPTCGKVEFFDPEEDIACLSCGATIKAGQDKCAACGWTWKD